MKISIKNKKLLNQMPLHIKLYLYIKLFKVSTGGCLICILCSDVLKQYITDVLSPCHAIFPKIPYDGAENCRQMQKILKEYLKIELLKKIK